MFEKIKKWLREWFGEPPAAKNRMLLVCSGNTCRSPMGQVLAKSIVFFDYDVESAGTNANRGEKAAANAIKLAAQFGYDLSGHRARHIADIEDLSVFDEIICFSK